MSARKALEAPRELAASRAEPRISRPEWTRMTILGAVVAWTLGMIPSTVIDLLGSAPHDASPPMTEPPWWLQLLLAAGLGAVAGPLLALFQRRPLRHVTSRANRWLLANTLAWAVGMPLTFLTMDVATARPDLPATLTLIVLGMTLTGALVGGIHGRFLEKLLPQ